MRRRVLTVLSLVAVVVLLSVAGAWWAIDARSTGATTPDSAAKAHFNFTYDWPAGTELVYALAWSAEETTRLPVPGEDVAPAHGVLAIEGELVLRSYGRSGDAFVLTARLRELRRHELDFWGQKVLADEETARATLASHEARLQVSPAGTLENVSFASDAPDLFKHLMMSLVTDLQVPVPVNGAPGGEWEAEEPTHFGRARVRYQADGAETLTRERTSYVALHVLSGGAGPHRTSTAGAIRLSSEGHLVSLRELQTLVVNGSDGQDVLDARTSLDLALKTRRHFDLASAPLAAVGELRRPGEVAFSENAERRMLEQRVDGMTGEQLLSDLERMGNGGMMPDHNRWLWRATGLLQLHPELAMKLGEQFQAVGTNTDGKALILDLLAAASTQQAQQVMREALASPAARDDKAYPLLLQRFSIVPAPDPESARFLARSWQDAAHRKDENVERASAMALGSVINGLQTSGDTATAREHLGVLTRALDEAKDPADRAVLMRALGNAGMEETAPVILAAAADDSAELRAAAASALRKRPEAEATRALIGLAQDKAALVGQTALVSLDTRTLADEELATFLTAVKQGRTAPANDEQLATVLFRYLQRSPDVAQALEFLVTRNAQNPDLQARLNAILRDAAPAGG